MSCNMSKALMLELKKDIYCFISKAILNAN